MIECQTIRWEIEIDNDQSGPGSTVVQRTTIFGIGFFVPDAKESAKRFVKLFYGLAVWHIFRQVAVANSEHSDERQIREAIESLRRAVSEEIFLVGNKLNQETTRCQRSRVLSHGSSAL
jgi:hypothetical protein